MAKIGILGSGAWGTALADLLANNGNEVVVFGIVKEEIDEINKNHTNFKYFPFNFSINNSVIATNDIDFAVDGAEIIVLAVPSFAIKETISKIKDKISESTIIVNVAKGFDKQTKKPLGRIIKDELPENCQKNLVDLLGPTFAEEVAQRQYTAIVASSESEESMEKVQKVFSNSYFRVYTNGDTVGAEYCGALKNVIALACGIVEGIGCKVNTRSALITRGMSEIIRYVTFFGGNEKTCYGLAGIGDLVLTCSSMTSRNYSAGVTIGQNGIDYFMATNKKTVEGIYACEIAYEIAKDHGIYSPIVTAVYNVIQGVSKPEEEVKRLMQQAPKNEV